MVAFEVDLISLSGNVMVARNILRPTIRYFRLISLSLGSMDTKPIRDAMAINRTRLIETKRFFQ
jgi:hypothetical protein